MPRPQLLRAGRLVDPLNGRIQHGIELGIGLLGRQPLDQRPREARHDAVIPAQAVVGFVLQFRPTARPPSRHWDGRDAIDIEIDLAPGGGELEHDQRTCGQFVELVEDGRFEQFLGLGFFGAVNVHFRLDDRHQADGNDPLGASSNCWLAKSYPRCWLGWRA